VFTQKQAYLMPEEKQKKQETALPMIKTQAIPEKRKKHFKN
jgi:hypothetical protein